MMSSARTTKFTNGTKDMSEKESFVLFVSFVAFVVPGFGT